MVAEGTPLSFKSGNGKKKKKKKKGIFTHVFFCDYYNVFSSFVHQLYILSRIENIKVAIHGIARSANFLFYFCTQNERIYLVPLRSLDFPPTLEYL